mgnify:CR=1 FL=1
MITATLIVAAITITSLYFGIHQLIDSGGIDLDYLDDINWLFLFSVGIAIVATFIVIYGITDQLPTP